ncbi:MAG: hypothetical protein IJP68_13370, partial [Selenomonadaceae bacterium]|nr:hypothetical protein [Selenomonadaceae bacterium]
IGTADNPLWFANTANKSVGLDLYGKGIYVKGVNSGVLTLGDVVGEFMSASSEGSIAQGDGKKLNLTNKLEVFAANDITLDNADNLIKAASILDGNNIKLNSANADGLTLDGLKAKGDAIITSDNALTLNGNIESENISLTAGTDLTSDKASLLKANKLITLKADDVKLGGKVETAYKEMTSDKVEDVEKFIEEMPAIIVTTNKGLDMRNAANNFEGLYVNSDGEQISGAVSVTGNSDGFLAVIDKNVTNDITIKNTKSNGVIILLDRGILNSTKGNITLEMGGSFLAGAALWANKDINITSRNDSVTIAPLNVLIENNNTSTEIGDTLKAVRNINLKAAKTIEVGGQVTAGRNVTAKSSGIGILNNGSINAGSGIDLTARAGDIKIEGSATANKGNVTMTIDKGNLDIAGKLRANKGEIEITLEEGNVQIGKDTPDAETVTAKGDINMTTGNGTITISGKTKSTSGSVNVKANEKNQNVLNNANLAEDSAGVILNSAEIDELESGDIMIDAEIEANDSVWIATDEGDIAITKSITVNDGDIIIATLDGDITIDDNGAVTIAGKIATTDGDIEFKKISADNAEIKTVNG